MDMEEVKSVVDAINNTSQEGFDDLLKLLLIQCWPTKLSQDQ
jgi:hypothetical protein